MQLNDKLNCTYWRKFQMWTLNPCGQAATDYIRCTYSIIIYRKAHCLVFVSKFLFFPTVSQSSVLLTTDGDQQQRPDEEEHDEWWKWWEEDITRPPDLFHSGEVNSCKKVDIPQGVRPSQTRSYLQHKRQLSNRECFAWVFITDYYLHNWRAASLHSAGVCLSI